MKLGTQLMGESAEPVILNKSSSRTEMIEIHNRNNEVAANSLRLMLSYSSSPLKRKCPEAAAASQVELTEDEKADANDVVRLYEDGYRHRYYLSKFGVDVTENPNFPITVAHHYVKGIAWVLAYYYQGCIDWGWYFPYNYAPFACDFHMLHDVILNFGREVKPFNPLEQLMAVFPSDSRQHVPSAWRDLMTESSSKIIDFYPSFFKVDLNGKRFAWQGVALLPFVEEDRLLKELHDRYDALSSEEKRRNIRGKDCYFVNTSHNIFPSLTAVDDTTLATTEGHTLIDGNLTNGLFGAFDVLQGNKAKRWPVNGVVDTVFQLQLDCSTSDTSLYPSIKQCNVLQGDYFNPTYPPEFVFPSRLLSGVELPENVVPVNEHANNRQNDSFHCRGSFRNPAAPIMNRMVRHHMPPPLPPPRHEFHNRGYPQNSYRLPPRHYNFDERNHHRNEHYIERHAPYQNRNEYEDRRQQRRGNNDNRYPRSGPWRR